MPHPAESVPDDEAINWDNIPDMAGPHYLNFLYHLMAIRLSSGSSHLQPRAFHMFYKYTTDITYITESGRKKNKQARTWVYPKHKKHTF